MKIVGISDLHGHLPMVEDMPEGEVLCICGDIVPLNIQRDTLRSLAWFYLDFIPWTDSLPYEKVLFVAGNHDFFLESIGPKVYKTASGVMDDLLPDPHKGEHKLVYLCDSSYIYKGFQFYGTPWCAELSNWAFFKTSESDLKHGKGLKDTFDEIPFNTDVILTHMPPRLGGAGQVLQHGCFNTLTNYGSQDLAEALDAKNFKYLLCGHVHSGDHKPYDFAGRMIVNVSLKDENYKVAYEPFVFEIE